MPKPEEKPVKPIPVATELPAPIVVPGVPAEVPVKPDKPEKPEKPKLRLRKPYARIQVIVEYDSDAPGLNQLSGVEKTDRILKFLARDILADALPELNAAVSYNLTEIPE
jgi:hypothetical protein